MIGMLISAGKFISTFKLYFIIFGVALAGIVSSFYMGKNVGKKAALYSLKDEQIEAINDQQEMRKEAKEAKEEFEKTRAEATEPIPPKEDVKNAMKSLEF